MRKRFFHERVCTCSPVGGVTYLQARLLQQMLNRSVHAIRCAQHCSWKAQRALVLGDLCAECGHPVWAMRIWRFALQLIFQKDYDDWIDVWFNTRYVRLGDVISEGICEVLGRRIDDLYRRYGYHELARWEDTVAVEYEMLYYEKYDIDPDMLSYYHTDMEAYEAQLETERLFREAQGELPPCARDIFAD